MSFHSVISSDLVGPYLIDIAFLRSAGYIPRQRSRPSFTVQAAPVSPTLKHLVGQHTIKAIELLENG